MTHLIDNNDKVRPHTDIHGQSISQGDLIQISSSGMVFHAYVDDTHAEMARPAFYEDHHNAQWFHELNWSSAELLQKAATG